METISGKLTKLKRVNSTNSQDGMTRLSFNLNNITVEFASLKEINIKNGDKILIAGMIDNNIFKAYSYKKL